MITITINNRLYIDNGAIWDDGIIAIRARIGLSSPTFLELEEKDKSRRSWETPRTIRERRSPVILYINVRSPRIGKKVYRKNITMPEGSGR